MARISATQRGRPHSAEHNAKVAATLTGRKLSPQHVAAMTKHGMSRHPHYPRHRAMMARCYNPNAHAYRYYGGRGITVCAEWHDPRVFCAWVDANLGPLPQGYSLDRIDSDQGYRPGNVRWASRSQQNSNRRPYTKPATR